MIYFVTSREHGRVKIGFSEKPAARFVKMRTDSPVPIVFERMMDGGRETEAVLHILFADDRLHGEWFTLSEQIDTFMSRLTIPTSTRQEVSKANAITRSGHAQIIHERGGIRAVARKLGHRNSSTVQGWVERDHIPEAHRPFVVALTPENAA